MQKVAVNLILNKKHSYQEALQLLNLTTLKERRRLLSARFAEKCLTNGKTKDMFQIIKKKHMMITRKEKNIKKQMQGL